MRCAASCARRSRSPPRKGCLSGAHHFYITFDTTAPGVQVAPSLKALHPNEMTIVLQHQFWDLSVEEGDGSPGAGHVSIGLSFGGVPSMLVIPIAAITAFADPHVRFGVRFSYTPPPEPPAAVVQEAEAPDDAPIATAAPQVVSLDAFRRRTPPRET